METSTTYIYHQETGQKSRSVNEKQVPLSSSTPLHVSDDTAASGTSTQPTGNKSRSQNPYPTTWMALQSAQKEMLDELVNIQHLVDQTQASSGSNPLVPLMEFSINNDPESLAKIGRWGEELVFVVLKRRGEMPNGKKIKNVVWVNEGKETGWPYDIEVELESDNQDKVYIEVKSTAASNKELVTFSWKELKFAEEKSLNYHLYRVYSAGKASHKLCQLENLHRYLQEQPIRLLFLL